MDPRFFDGPKQPMQSLLQTGFVRDCRMQIITEQPDVPLRVINAFQPGLHPLGLRFTPIGQFFQIPGQKYQILEQLIM
ncbi:hypothetical protein D1872_287750 [compost metagenome]